jgi:sodium/potassium-transporting ATPase subunit alpha
MSSKIPAKLDSQTTQSEDIEAADPRLPQRITFELDEGPQRRGRTTGSRHRSVSRNSVSSIHSRAQSVSGIPIEFRTLFFQISDSQAIEEPEKTTRSKEKKEKKADKDYFEILDFHLGDSNTLCGRLDVKPDHGLGTSDAAARLSQDGKNTVSRRCQNYLKKLFI